MVYEVDGWNNFCRVFEEPENYPEGFCFGGGIACKFLMVDWFNPVPGVPQPAVSKEQWKMKVGNIEIKTISHEELEDSVLPFVKEKVYIKPGRRYLILFSFGAVIRFQA